MDEVDRMGSARSRHRAHTGPNRPTHQAFRANEAFGSCVADLQQRQLLFDAESGKPTVEYIACTELCDGEPNRLVLLGRWVHMRTGYDGGAACGGIGDADPELADIFLP